ncbi:hypothetical protein RCO48_25635 [Peribacillus frigoritolerans]|nr:hypothetical protein [Peribacillus frigoritolerans]
MNQEAKIKVGKKAVELISNGDVIAIDVGTTMLEFAQCIENKKRHYDFNQFSSCVVSVDRIAQSK